MNRLYNWLMGCCFLSLPPSVSLCTHSLHCSTLYTVSIPVVAQFVRTWSWYISHPAVFVLFFSINLLAASVMFLIALFSIFTSWSLQLFDLTGWGIWGWLVQKKIKILMYVSPSVRWCSLLTLRWSCWLARNGDKDEMMERDEIDQWQLEWTGRVEK